ncbi:PEP/pyruvate-binding domain-containing protein [Kibdelosporangium aridum]|nr:PEP/pyruvate-binding domain-containing protein [Kibdelosporangium aridum]
MINATWVSVPTANGTGLQPVPVASASEDLYGMPMDIEWAVHDGQFAILQARPSELTGHDLFFLRFPPNRLGTGRRDGAAGHDSGQACGREPVREPALTYYVNDGSLSVGLGRRLLWK